MTMEKALKFILIGLFIVILIGAIVFAMSVEGPGLPEAKKNEAYMIKDDGRQVSCFFPFLGKCATTKNEKQSPQ